MGKIIGLYGAGGFGREIMPILQAQSDKDDRVFFVETDLAQPRDENGVKVLSHDEFAALDGEKHFNVAIADSKIRQKIAEQCLQENMKTFDIYAKNADISVYSDIDSGVIISGFCTIAPNVQIGRFFQTEYYSYIAHDCVIGDFVTFAPRVNCNGNVHIGDHAYIGTGAVIKQGTPEKPLKIGEGAIVGMGAVVTKDVPPGTTVIGNPARPLNRK